MKKYLIILAGSLLFATTAAIADPPQYRGQDGQDNHGRQDKHDQRGDRGDHGDRGEHGRRDDHDRYGNRGYDRGDGDGRGYYVRHDRGRHEGWYKRGGYVPQEYRGSRYVVTDWRRDHLREPPRGYHWVRGDDNQFLLVAVASGVIADILLSH